MRTLALVLALGLTPLAAQKAGVSRTEMAAMERSFDERLRKSNVENPFVLLGLTRGVYLDGYGAVFTAEVNLVQGPGITPFRQELSPEDIARVKAAKVQRLPMLRQLMREMLLNSASSLDRVPMDEQIVLGVTLFHHPWEDAKGLPQQIVMQAKRRALLDVATSRATKETLETELHVKEY
jgi:hypothetical protein